MKWDKPISLVGVRVQEAESFRDYRPEYVSSDIQRYGIGRDSEPESSEKFSSDTTELKRRDLLINAFLGLWIRANKTPTFVDRQSTKGCRKF
jgi:hypothetical protein